MTEPDWIGVRLHGPLDVMRRLAARLHRALQPNDDRGAVPLDQIRTGRVYFWVRPDDAQLDRLVQLLLAARPEGDAAPVRQRRRQQARRR
jgi:hypothetical protein